MRIFRLTIARWSCALALAVGVLVIGGHAQGQLPLEPMGRTGESVTPAFEGWYPNDNDSFNLLIGYYNRNSAEALDIPVGPNNRIEPGGPDYGQPTHFLTGRQWGIFTITVPKDFGAKMLTWTIVVHGQTNSIPIGISNPLYMVEPLRDPAMGNKPPILRFEPAGKAFTGPPIGTVASLSTAVSSQLPLTVLLSHPPDWKPEQVRSTSAGRAKGSDLKLTWSKYRGAGVVKFGNNKPEVSTADGKTTTSATFSQAGDYVLRAQVNDHTGDGGAGFQCCWTNVLVGVSVKPDSAGR